MTSTPVDNFRAKRQKTNEWTKREGPIQSNGPDSLKTDKSKQLFPRTMTPDMDEQLRTVNLNRPNMKKFLDLSNGKDPAFHSQNLEERDRMISALKEKAPDFTKTTLKNVMGNSFTHLKEDRFAPPKAGDEILKPDAKFAGITGCIFRDTIAPPPDGKYNPTLWNFIIEKISNGGKRDSINDDFRRAFEPFAKAIPETKIFLLNRPVFIDEIALDKQDHERLTVFREFIDAVNEEERGYLTKEDIENAEPAFPVMWIESYEKHREIFQYKERSDDVIQIGYWSLRVGFQKSSHMGVIQRGDHLYCAIFPTGKSFAHANQMIWANLEPFMSSGWAATKELFTADCRNRIHKKYKKYISHSNRIAVINSDKAQTDRAIISSGMRKYGFCWEVRGYYRKLHNPETMGVNANGERIIKGKTWVRPHTKGDTAKPKIEKRWKVKM